MSAVTTVNNVNPITLTPFKQDAEARCEYRRSEEAMRGVEILERIEVLGQTRK